MSKEICAWCGERITNSDELIRPSPGHLECSLRAILGSVGHLRKKCSCYGGTEEDPPLTSNRDAARLAVIEAIIQCQLSLNDLGWPAMVRARMRPSTYSSMPKDQQRRIDEVLDIAPRI